MDDPFLMGMLDGLADGRKQLQPLPDGQLVAGRSNPVMGTPWTSSITK